jgi:hypothetical protein
MTSKSEQLAVNAEGKPHYRSLDELSRAQQAQKERPKQFHLWANRAQPILARMLASGHGVNMDELHQTLDLLVAHAEKDPGALDPSVSHKSHLERVLDPTLDSE